MKTKNAIAVFLVAFIITSCMPEVPVIPTETALPMVAFSTSTSIPVIPNPTEQVSIKSIVPSTPLPNDVLNDVFISDISGLNLRTTDSVYDGFDNSNLEVEVVPSCSHTGKYGVKLNYDVNETPTGMQSWAIWVDELPLINIESYQALDLWVKGVSGGEVFSIDIATEWQQDLHVLSTNYVEVSQTEWRKVHVPFLDFINSYPKPKWSTNIWGVTIFFDDNSGYGSICVDDISFVP